MEVSVREAARELGLSPRRIRALVAQGKLPARRLEGRQLLIDLDAVRARADRPARSGRPISCRSAWAVIRLLEDLPLREMSASERTRARRRVHELPDLPPGALASRAEVHRLRAHPGVLDRLRTDERLLLSGPDAARVHHADLVPRDGVEAYVRSEDRDPVVKRYRLEQVPPASANVVLHVLPADVDEVPSSDGVVASSLLSLDLIDAGDERSVRAGRALLARQLARAARS